MTKKKEQPLSDAEKARRAFSSYITRLGARLEEEDCPSSVLSEARKFFEGQGLSLEDVQGEKPSESKQRESVMRLLECQKRSG